MLMSGYQCKYEITCRCCGETNTVTMTWRGSGWDVEQQDKIGNMVIIAPNVTANVKNE